MIILNESIVSPILLKVLEEQQIPVLEQGQWGVTLTSEKLNIQKDTEFFKSMEMDKRILTNSENGITLLGHFQPNSIDGYYNQDGEPVILNVFKRLFKDDYDTSDRIYYTSKLAINEIYHDALKFMKNILTVLPLRNYPVHFEIRKKGNRVIPIEINPLRFAGAGTTDLGYHAYGMNMYEHYFSGTKPDWNRILEEMDDHIYSFFFAEVPLEINLEDVARIDHAGLRHEFEHVLEYRQLPFQNDRSMAIIFYRSENLNKNLQLLQLDLIPYLTIKHLVFN